VINSTAKAALSSQPWSETRFIQQTSSTQIEQSASKTDKEEIAKT